MTDALGQLLAIGVQTKHAASLASNRYTYLSKKIPQPKFLFLLSTNYGKINTWGICERLRPAMYGSDLDLWF